MFASTSRRQFLRTGAAGAMVGLGDLAFLSRLRPVSAAEASLDRGVVALRPEIAPIVKLLEETPRERLLEEVAQRLHGGLSYRDLLAALLLAGVKNVEPRPSVGHKFHTVLVVNSAHLASISSPPEHRWLPIFWALDYFKAAAARDVKERGDWTMSGVDEAAVPSPGAAADAFARAMNDWDVEAADAAAVGLVRTAGAAEVYEQLFHYGMRDFRSIGHKAIYAANSYRTLQCIGWEHAEPVLRSLTYALLMHEGENPGRRDAAADRPYRRNTPLVDKFRPDWQGGVVDDAATQDLITALRSSSHEEACDHVVELINRGIAPQSIWDAMFVAAGELLMKQPAIVALHAVTTSNAMHFAFKTSGDDRTRRMAMLQNAAFLTMFRQSIDGGGRVKAATVEELRRADPPAAESDAVGEIFAGLRDEPDLAAARTFGYLQQTQDARKLIDAARVLVFLKGDNAHDYKFSSAVLEDYYHVSPQWRDLYLASNVFMLRGSQLPDNQLVSRTRAALGA